MRKRLRDELIRKLREAIDETLAMSFPVVEALADLDEAGFCPALHVDITLADDAEEPHVSEQQGASAREQLALTQDDDSFLRTLGISVTA